MFNSNSFDPIEDKIQYLSQIRKGGDIKIDKA